MTERMPPPSLPKHIAFIMDGNGRWAKERNLPRSEGHRAGIAAFKKIFPACLDMGISYVSLFAFSTENWNRPKDEIDKLFGFIKTYFKSELPKFIKNGVKITLMGDISRLSKELQEIINEAVTKTAGFTGKGFNIGLNYGSRSEIIRAVNNMLAAGVTRADERLFGQFLYTAGMPDPDLLIRTSEKRLSNFMLYQCAYTEIYFIDKYWPDFDKKALRAALDDYAGRQRRFGAVK